MFIGRQSKCGLCYIVERVCIRCGETFNGSHTMCRSCCRAAMAPEKRAAQDRRTNNARRARKLGAEVEGPVPAEMYTAIRNSGPCVYCGGQSAAVDHVRPLTKGGWEHEDNLVPACKPCNSSKGAKLLTEWNPHRVAHAITLSSKVAVEYARLTDSE
ncbi:HNH endonuclease [Rhodococcus sp. NPDC056960]|uniref:HNH endonuclease n=1 Tax=Rhodococcus sp. NPDC056960 TaxID=3345982 RepID=UPI003642C39A